MGYFKVDIRAAGSEWNVNCKHSSKTGQPKGPTAKAFNEHGTGDGSKPVEDLKAPILPQFKLDFRPKIRVHRHVIRTIPVLEKKVSY